MLIHRKTIRALGQPERIRLLINADTRHLCIQGCDDKEPCSFVVPREMTSLQYSFYIHSKLLLGQICSMMGWNPGFSYRVFGKINTHTTVLDFNLTRFVQMNLIEYLENDEVPEEFMADYPSSSDPVPAAPPEVPAPRLIQPDWQALIVQVPIVQAPRPIETRFMGGLYDSVQLPDQNGGGHD